MRSASSARCSPATTGAGAPPASSRRCGRSACAAWSRPTATTSRTSPARPSRRAPEQEQRLWYQYYFHTERGRAGLQANRREFCKLLWRLWSPNWQFDDATFERTAASFDNPDFVEVVIHSYRYRFGYAPGDPSLEAIERQLAAKPRITVPTIVLHGDGSGLSSPESSLRQRADVHRALSASGDPGGRPQSAGARCLRACVSERWCST